MFVYSNVVVTLVNACEFSVEAYQVVALFMHEALDLVEGMLEAVLPNVDQIVGFVLDLGSFLR